MGKRVSVARRWYYAELRPVVVEALIAAGRWAEAAAALTDLCRSARFPDDAPASADETFGDIAALADGSVLGPLRHDAAWVLARQRALAATGVLDARKQHTWELYADYLLGALRAGQVAEAVDFVRANAEAARAIEHGHYHFNAVCVLAHAGLIDEAVAAVRDLVRRAYGLLWRFNRSAAAAKEWVRETGQGEWLAPLEGVPAFEALRDGAMTHCPPASGTLRPGPFRSVHRTDLTGRSRKRCAVSGRLIAPGEPIYRFRLYFGDGRGDPRVAGKDASEASALAGFHRRHVGDRYDPVDFRPPPAQRSAQRFRYPDAAAYLFDLGHGTPFAVDTFIALIADPRVFPMRHVWIRGAFDLLPEPGDGPCVNDAVAGDCVNLTWVVLRCGYGPALFARLRQIDAAVADPIVAMLATFDRSDCRAASAAHFGLPALPAVMAVAFQGRLSLDDILRVAAFGRDEPRFADALARALAAYNLHIYATVRLQADWYLEDLERYALARGCRLVFFLIHRPERMPMLATMLEKRWLVGGVGLGGYDEILNTGHALFQAAAMNRLLHAPEDLAFWLETPWIARYVDAPTRRTVGRHVAAYRKRGRA